MTPTIKTLTAVAALTLASGAWAQDTQTVPLGQPDDSAVTAPETGTTVVVEPDGSKQVLTAEETEAPEAEAPEAEATEAAADEAAADEADEAEAAATDDATDDQAVTEATSETEDGTEEAAAEEEPADEAVDAATEDDATEDEAAEADTTEAAEAADTDEAEAVAEDAGTATAEDDADEVAADDADEAVSEDEAEAEEDVAAVDEAPAAEPVQELTDVAFSFEGPFGRYDSLQLQRGLQVYTEICAACHGLQYVPIRTLSDATGPNMPEDQVRAYAAEFEKYDPDLDEDVPREPADNFPHVPHVEGMGPDLSLMAKARAGFHGPYGTGINQLFHGIGGPEYIYSILTHYTGETKEEAGTTLYENTAFPGGWISMPPPIFDESLDFEDGHPNDLDSIATEVSAFLMWTAEPKMMQRKQMGLVSVLFLILLSVLLYLTNKRLWTPHKHPRRED